MRGNELSGTDNLTKGDLLIMGTLFLVALGIKFYFLQFCRVISSDGVAYAQIARDILAGRGFAGATHFPPFYPLLVALFHTMFSDIELAGRLAAMFMGSLLVIPVYLLAREFFDRQVGIMAAVLVMAWPSLRLWSNEVMSQSTYITLVLLGGYLIWHACKSRSVAYAVAGGLAMGMAHLTRSEGVLVFLVLSLVLAVDAGVKRDGRQFVCLLAGWCAFVVVFFPYAYFLHEVTGTWQLTGKSRVALADSLMEYLGRPDLKRDPAFQEIGYLDVVRRYPDFLRQNIPENLMKFIREFVPPYLWLLGLLGFCTGGWSRDKLKERAFLIATFAPMGIIVVFFFIGPEYTQPYLPVFFLWVSAGALWMEKRALALVGVGRHPLLTLRGAGGMFSLAATVLFALYLLVGQVPADRNLPYHFSQDGGRYDHKRIGQLLNEYLPKSARIMTRWGRVGFYADRGWVDMPQASLEEIVATARKSGTRYIVVDGALAGLRPQLGVLYEPLFVEGASGVYVEKGDGFRPLPGLKLYFLYRDPSSVGVAVYEVLG
ncbi:hypothetical protein AOG1_16630 [Geobacter sp. AOG1]|nr:hypothetical protein AOG1_16630 [Geobacter sp. AOG1]